MPGFSLTTLIRAISVWLLFILAESAQGALRRLLVGPEVELAIRQISVLVGALVIFALAWGLHRWLSLRSAAGALAVGVLWAGLTLAFEIGLGRLLGLPWSRIAADYDLAHGGLMPLGLLAMALTPWTVRRLRGG